MICVHIYANIFWREHYRGQSGQGKKRMSIKVTIHLYSPSFRPDFSFNFNLKLSWHRHWLSSNQKKHFYCRIWTIELLPNPWIIRTKFSSTSDDIETRTKTSIKLVCFVFSSKQVSLFEIELSRQPKYRHPPFTFMLIIQEINFFFNFLPIKISIQAYMCLPTSFRLSWPILYPIHTNCATRHIGQHLHLFQEIITWWQKL